VRRSRLVVRLGRPGRTFLALGATALPGIIGPVAAALLAAFTWLTRFGGGRRPGDRRGSWRTGLWSVGWGLGTVAAVFALALAALAATLYLVVEAVELAFHQGRDSRSYFLLLTRG
jgi:hypothetical protein